ncbi:MAG: N-acetylmuramoyl-L-alanine amidase [Clostridia bacterium]|nr:N-acetylmuramoyl-L-alanine amidase [Clostridia bacterium]
MNKKEVLIRLASLFTVSTLLVFTAVFALGAGTSRKDNSILTDGGSSVKEKEEKFVLILDAGHGGEDGGATGLSGALEKELNLQVTLKTAELLEAMGYEVLLTREDDRMLGEGEKGHKKLADLKYRLEFANSHENALLISIHMNKFPMEYCKGIQLYYAPANTQSLPLAKILHALVKDFQPENQRELKEAGSAIYLLDRTTVPALLMECGFLSNAEEEALLKSEDYQKQLTCLIACTVCKYEEGLSA